jgi:hypothetical protein
MTPAERFLEATRNTLPCCVNCEHFSTSMVQQTVYRSTETAEFCVLAQCLPPAKIIAFGCARFSQDIPF